MRDRSRGLESAGAVRPLLASGSVFLELSSEGFAFSLFRNGVGERFDPGESSTVLDRPTDFARSRGPIGFSPEFVGLVNSGLFSLGCFAFEVDRYESCCFSSSGTMVGFMLGRFNFSSLLFLACFTRFMVGRFKT